jgi:uncharacterized membrane protein
VRTHKLILLIDTPRVQQKIELRRNISGWNTFAPPRLRFDPYPAFVLWLFLSNVLQMMLMPLSMIGQNLQGRHAEARAAADFEVNLKAEREGG